VHITLHPGNGIPLAVQIQHGLRLAIVAGELQPDEQLPSARDLSAELGVNFHTVRKAFAGLEVEGLLEMRRGLGTFVAGTQPLRLRELRRLVRTELESMLGRLVGNEGSPEQLRTVLHQELDRLLKKKKP